MIPPGAIKKAKATERIADWVAEEMADADLKDQRLNRRLNRILSDLSQHPTASIPAACGGHAEMTAAYRFFDNDKVDFDTVLQPHIDRTRARIAAQPVVLLVPDTTEIDLTRPEQQVQGGGPLDGGTRRGVFLHADARLHPRRHAAGDHRGDPLGPRRRRAHERHQDPRRARRRADRGEGELPLAARRCEQARAEAARCPGTQLVFVADSEADIYDVIAAGMEEPRTADWIVRSCQDRALVDDLEDRDVLDYLREELLAAPVLDRRTITVRGRTGQGGLRGPGPATAAEVARGGRRGPGRRGHPPRPGADGRAIARRHGQRRAGHRGGSARGDVAGGVAPADEPADRHRRSSAHWLFNITALVG